MHVDAKFAKMLMLVTTITIMKILMVLVMIMLMVKKMMMKRMMVLMMAITSMILLVFVHMCFARFLNTIVRNPGMQMLFMCRSRSQVYIPLGRW